MQENGEETWKYKSDGLEHQDKKESKKYQRWYNKLFLKFKPGDTCAF